jgi:hypothetical protein
MIIFRKKLKSFCYSPDFEVGDDCSMIPIEKVLSTYDMLLRYLDEPLYVEPHVTFGEFLSPIFDEWQQFENLFASQLGHFSLSEFRDEWESPSKTTEHEDLTLEVGWSTFEINVDDISMSDPYLPMFHGTRIITEEDKKDPLYGSGEPGELEYFAVEFIAINDLKNCIFKINDTVKIAQFDIKAENDFKYKVLGSFKLSMSFYNVISAILYEISFLGGPSDRTNFKEDLIGRFDDCKNDDLSEDFHEITLDENGNICIDGESQSEKFTSEENEHSKKIDNLLNRFKIDRPKK